MGGLAHLLDYQFMRSAFLAMLLLAPLLGMLGTQVVSARMAFFADALGHSAFAGIAIGVLLGVSDPLLAMIGFGLVFAVGIVVGRERGGASADTTIGVFSSFAMALGILLLSVGGGFAKYSAFLVGDVLAIGPADLLRLAAVLAVFLAYWVLVYNRLLLSGIQTQVAQSRGVRVLLHEILFNVMVAVVVMVSIRWVGLLVINAMLVVPAAAARRLSGSVRAYQALSVGISLVSGLAGLVVSYLADVPAGAAFVVVAAAAYLVSVVVSRIRGKA
jgi:zinc transport system permease protein